MQIEITDVNDANVMPEEELEASEASENEVPDVESIEDQQPKPRKRGPWIAPDPAAQNETNEELSFNFDNVIEDETTDTTDTPEDTITVEDAFEMFDEEDDQSPIVSKEEYDEIRQQLEELQIAHETLLAEHATLEKRHETFQNDWDNYRRRTEENLVKEKANASKALVTAILPPLDDFERAITHAQQIGADAEVVSGMYAIYKKIIDILGKEGVQQIRGKGEKFDMETQQAIERREGTDLEDDVVAEVYQTGYVMNGVVLRPALVAVTA